MMLHGEGKIDYLVLKPNAGIFELGGTFEWVDDVEKGRISQGEYFPYAEGIDVAKDELFFISKVFKSMFILNLDNGTYQKYSTNHGLFDGQPDQVLRILDDDDDGMLYFTEDGGDYAGVHARNRKGQFFTVLESPSLYHESTGLSFSPNGLFMYFAFQESKILFEVKREDGLSFKANTLDVKYHNFAVPLG